MWFCHWLVISIYLLSTEPSGLYLVRNRINFFIPAVQYKCFCKQCRSRWDGSKRAISSGSTLFATLLLIIWLKPLFAAMGVSKFRDGRVHFRIIGVKELVISIWPWTLLKGNMKGSPLEKRPVGSLFDCHKKYSARTLNTSQIFLSVVLLFFF